MKCPFCRIDNDRVIDTRTSEQGATVRRRRACLSCDRRYTTYERVEEAVIKVVKKDGAREAFSREKLMRGLEKACRKRPVSEERMERIITEIEDHIFSRFDVEVDSRQLGELLMEALRELDQIAYVRFASVYRDFQDVQDFVDELEPMIEETKRPDA